MKSALMVVLISGIICSCTMKNSASLSFSSANTPIVNLQINSGVKYTKITSVPVVITANADVTEMTVAVSSSCSTTWESYQQNKTLTLPSVEAEQTISVQVRTKDGFKSDCTQGKIVFDQTAPTFSSSLVLASARSLLTESPKINTPSFVDSLSGVDKYELKLIHNKSSGGTEIIQDWTEKSKDSLYFTGLSLLDAEAETYYYVVRATDKAGNVSSEVTSPTFIPGPIMTLSGYTDYSTQHTMGYIQFNLSRAITSAVTVTAKSVSSSAIAGVDFQYPDVVPDSVTIAAGATSGRGYFAINSSVSYQAAKYFDIQTVSVDNAASALPKMTFSLYNNAAAAFSTEVSGYKSITGYTRLYSDGIMCAITTANKLECWGNTRTGSNDFLASPTEISGVSNVASLSSGSGNHACVIDTNGDLYCYGKNLSSELGGTVTDTSLPLVKHPTLTNVKKVTAGKDFTCVIDSADAVKCWGNNAYCAIGQSCASASVYSSPTTISGITKAIDITAGNDIACAIDEISSGNRNVKCWGVTSSTTASATAVTVSGLPSDIQQISANGYEINGDTLTTVTHHGCGTTASGLVYCWGSNWDYQRASTSTSLTWNVATAVTLSAKATKVLVGPGRSCALMEDGSLYCWGASVPSTTSSNELLTTATPTQVTGFNENILDFVVTEKTNCAVTASSKIKCWGTNTVALISKSGYYANNTRYNAFSLGLTDTYSQIESGLDSSCALRSSAKSVTCWGNNSYGQLGMNDRNGRLAPGSTVSLSGTVKKISGNNRTFCALLESGSLYCWGGNLLYQVGNNTSTNYLSSPQAVMASASAQLTSVSDISVGLFHACAVTSSGTVKCWGNNSNYQSGQTNNTIAYAYANDVAGITGAISVSAGTYATCAVTSTSTTKSVYCWGDSSYKVTGTASASTYTPTLIETITTTKDVTVYTGWEGACYIHDGATKCWGKIGSTNNIPFVGTTGTTFTTPTAIASLAGATTITLGAYHGCAAMAEGQKCWGIDATQVFSSSAYNSSPVSTYAFQFGKISQIATTKRSEATSNLVICGLSSLGTLHCSGSGISGNNVFYYTSPTAVLK